MSLIFDNIHNNYMKRSQYYLLKLLLQEVKLNKTFENIASKAQSSLVTDRAV
jgi:hypothetical protein